MTYLNVLTHLVSGADLENYLATVILHIHVLLGPQLCLFGFLDLDLEVDPATLT